jgi:SAM-dependent methyltransferase
MQQISEVQTDPELQGYRLPYHWFLPRESIWTTIHDACVASAVEAIVQGGARRVLEVGCGDGWNCGQLVKAGCEVTGVDWSTQGIEHCRRLVPEGSFYCGDVTDERFQAEFADPFDAAMMVEVIEHIHPDDCLEALRNVRRCLKSGGMLIITTPSTNFPNENPRHFRHFTAQILTELVESAGQMRVKQISGYGDVVHLKWYQRFLPLVDNRLFAIKPIRNRMQRFCARHARNSPLDRCCGLVAMIEVVD